MWSEWLALFVSSFVSSTLFPGGSEALLLYFVQQNNETMWQYLLVATVGNSLGAIVTFAMGYFVRVGQKKAKRKYIKTWLFSKKYGQWALLLSWLPVIGDLLPLFAGWLRLPILSSCLLISLGKLFRYTLLITLYVSVA